MILAGNFERPDTFAWFNNNDSMHAINQQEFMREYYNIHPEDQKAGKKPLNEYYSFVRSFQQGKVDQLTQTHFDDSTYYYVNHNDPVQNILANKNAWTTLNNIVNKNNGAILSFDTETIGNLNVNTEGIERDIAGITEFGFSITTFGNRYKDDRINLNGSIVLGIDDEQEKGIRQILSKKRNGEVLTAAEQSTMERMSRYSTLGDTPFSYQTTNINGTTLDIAYQINTSKAFSDEDIVSGIENLHEMYKSYGADDVTRKAERTKRLNFGIDIVNDFANKGNNRVIIGQNLNYDINAVQRQREISGAEVHELSNFEYADTLSASRMSASVTGLTENERNKIINPLLTNPNPGRQEAMVEAITGSTEYTTSEAHNAYYDARSNIDIATDKKLGLINNATETINNGTQDTVLNDKFIRINKGGFDRRTDFLSIDGKSTTAYATANQIWQFDGITDATFGTETIEGKHQIQTGVTGDRFVARFKSVDESNAVLYKTFDSQNDFDQWLTYNTSFVNKDNLNIQAAETVKHKDTARRIMESFFQPNSTTVGSKGVENGGFAEAKKYLGIYDYLHSLDSDKIAKAGFTDITGSQIGDIGSVISNLGVGDNFEKLIKLTNGSDNPFNDLVRHNNYLRDNQRLAREIAIANYDTRFTLPEILTSISNNEDFFRTSISTIDDSFGTEGSNFQKTLVFESIFKNYQQTTGYIQSFNPAEYIIDKDINNVSISLKKGTYRAIDFSDPKKATSLLYRAFNGNNSNRFEVSNALLESAQDLVNRGVITKKDYRLITRSNHGENAYTLAGDIANAVSQRTSDIRQLSLDQYSLLAQSDTKEGIRLRSVLRPENYTVSSSTSLLSRLQGTIEDSESFTTNIKAEAEQVKNTVLTYANDITDSGLKDQNGHTITREAFNKFFENAGYDEKSIESFAPMFFGASTEGHYNIQSINKELGLRDGKEFVPTLFSGGKDNAGFLILTPKKSQGALIEELSKINETNTTASIKDTITKYGFYGEISKLEHIQYEAGIPGEKEFAQMLGIGDKPEVTLVKNGGSYKYLIPKLNVYEAPKSLAKATEELQEVHPGIKPAQNAKVIQGSIQSGGGQLLNNLRMSLYNALSGASNGKFSYKQTTRSFERQNKELLREAPGASISTIHIGDRVIRKHISGIDDFSKAYQININETNTLLKLFGNPDYQGKNNTARQVLSQLIQNFYNTYPNDAKQITAKGAEINKNQNPETILDSVLKSEQFSLFESKYLVDRNGGIGSSPEVKGFVNYESFKGLLDESISKDSNIKYGDLGITGLLDLAIQENFTDPNTDIIIRDNKYNTVAEAVHNIVQARLFNNTSISEQEHTTGTFISSDILTDSKYAPETRPTFTQNKNAKMFTVSSFRDTDYLTSNLGITLGEGAVTKTRYYAKQKSQEEFLKTLRQEGFTDAELANQKVSQNIVGVFQSVSDAELQSDKQAALNKLLAKTQNEPDKRIYTNIWERMYHGLNLYEGKAYVRPSIANQDFLTSIDAKSVKIEEIARVFNDENIDKEEKIFTAQRLKTLADNNSRIETGDLLGRYNGRDIIYHGPTIAHFTEQNLSDLRDYGSTSVIPEKQIEDSKIFVSMQEKATTESLMYWADPDHKEEQLKQTMIGLGFDKDLVESNSFDQNLHLINTYTDTAFSALPGVADNTSNFKTIVLMNNNVEKHLSDISIENKEQLIAAEYRRTGKSDKKLTREIRSLFLGISYGENGSKIFDPEKIYFENGNMILDFEGEDRGFATVIDTAFDRALNNQYGNADANISLKQDYEALLGSNAALVEIQAQQMNQFEAKEMKMEARYAQSIALGDLDSIETMRTRENAKHYEKLVEDIRTGAVDETRNISNLAAFDSSLKTYDQIYADIVRENRGRLYKGAHGSLLRGIYESASVLGDLRQNTNINVSEDTLISNLSDHVLKIKAEELFENLPSNTGSVMEEYADLIFRKDGKISSFLTTRAVRESINTANPLSMFLLDVSSYGLKYNTQNGQARSINFIPIPIQDIKTYGDDRLVAPELASKTTYLLNTIAGTDKTEAGTKKVSKALEEYYAQLLKEMDIRDKESTFAQSLRVILPNSSGGIARDAIVPVVSVDPGLFKRQRELNKNIFNADGSSINKDVIEELKSIATKIKAAEEEQAASITNNANIAGKDVLENITLSGSGITSNYKPFITGLDNTGKLTGTIENAIMTSREVFKRSDMDLGHIGFELVLDAYHNGDEIGIKSYESISKLTRSKFNISAKDIQNAINISLTNLNKEKNAQEFVKGFIAANDLLEKTVITDKEAQKLLSNFIASYSLELKMNSRIGTNFSSAIDESVTNEYKRKFIKAFGSGFEKIGARYASEVGLRSDISRYPLFNQMGTIYTRIFLDDTMRGNSVRFLGPQFSILQNLDFDGDTEFLRFIGNAGLTSLKDDEFKNHERNFIKQNSINSETFAQSLKDSLKEYKYADDKVYKAQLLKEAWKENYDRAEETFLEALSKEDRAYLENLKSQDTGKDIYDLTLAHSIQMKQEFESVERRFPTFSSSRPEMLRAAAQAVTAKRYIGNYSKPNLKIRDALIYQATNTEDDEILKSLSKYAQILSGYDIGIWNDKNITELTNEERIEYFNNIRKYGASGVGAKGITSILEQSGIDTKHVHDVETLNKSVAWRQGVNTLFNKGGSIFTSVDTDVVIDRRSALSSMVEGAEKIYFKDAIAEAGSDKETRRIAINKIVDEILHTNFGMQDGEFADDFAEAIIHGKTNDAIKTEGERAIRAIYELSLMTGSKEAYDGNYFKDIVSQRIGSLSEEDLKRISDTSSVGSIFTKLINKELLSNPIQEKYQIRSGSYGLAFDLNLGDLIAYNTGHGPEAYALTSIGDTKKGNALRIAFTQLSDEGELLPTRTKQQRAENQIIFYAKKNSEGFISIADLNKAIGEGKGKKGTIYTSGIHEQLTLIDTFFNKEKRQLFKLNEVTNVPKQASADYMEYMLSNLFKYTEESLSNNAEVSAEAVKQFKSTWETLQSNEVRDMRYSPYRYSRILNDIVGSKNAEDAYKVFKDVDQNIIHVAAQQKNVDEEILKVTGGDTNKIITELTRRINQEISRHPSAHKLHNSTFREYILGHDQAISSGTYNKEFLSAGESATPGLWFISTERLENIPDNYGDFITKVDNLYFDTTRNRQDLIKNYADEFDNIRRTNSIDDLEALYNFTKEKNIAITENTNKTLQDIYSSSNIKTIATYFGWADSESKGFKVDDKLAKIISEHSDVRVAYGEFFGTKISTLGAAQSKQIIDELNNILQTKIDISDNERIAIENSITLINTHIQQDPLLKKDFETKITTSMGDYASYADFRSKAALDDYITKNFLTNEENFSASKEAERAAREAAQNAEESGKKNVFDAFKEIKLTSKTKKMLGIGAGILTATTITGLAINASHNDKDYSSYNEEAAGMDISPESLKSRNINNARSSITSGNGNKYNTGAYQSENRKKKQAPSSQQKHKFRHTVYHDAGSGFNFKVSANSYNKLTDRSYQNLAGYGNSNNQSTDLRVYRDNSQVTDNWLENKFNDLSE